SAAIGSSSRSCIRLHALRSGRARTYGRNDRHDHARPSRSLRPDRLERLPQGSRFTLSYPQTTMKELRGNVTRVAFTNSGLVLFLYDDANADAIRSAGPTILEGFGDDDIKDP